MEITYQNIRRIPPIVGSTFLSVAMVYLALRIGDFSGIGPIKDGAVTIVCIQQIRMRDGDWLPPEIKIARIVSTGSRIRRSTVRFAQRSNARSMAVPRATLRGVHQD